MKYKDYEGTAEELVRRKIKEIEEKEHIRVLHAVESGSSPFRLYTRHYLSM